MSDWASLIGGAEAENARLCREDPLFLAREVLGWAGTKAGLYKRNLFETPCEYHVEVAAVLAEEKDFLVLVPRMHLKTAFITVGGTIFSLLRNPNHRALVVSETPTLAQKILREIKWHFQKNERLRAWFPEYRIDDADEAGTQTHFDLPCRTGPKKDFSVEAIGIGGATAGGRFDSVRGTDILSDKTVPPVVTPETAEKTFYQFRAMRSLLDNTNPKAFMCCEGCVTAETKVLMRDNSWKPIIDVRAGEYVWGWDGARGLTLAPVVWSGRTKTAPVYKVKTRSGEIRATAEHPFLVLQSNGKNHATLRGDKWTPAWVRADRLRNGDRILHARETSGALPPRVSDDQAWLLGYLFGDGCLIRGRYQGMEDYIRGFIACVGHDVALRQRVASVAKAWWGREPKWIGKFAHLRLDCVQAGRDLYDLGLNGTAKTKRVPKWMFEQPVAIRREFVKGFMDADGNEPPHSAPMTWRCEISNRGLADDLRTLCMTSGGRATPLRHRTRTIKAPGSPAPVKSETTILFCSLNDYYRWSSSMSWGVVESIELEEEQDVYDITVEGIHSFVAEGMVVHNTIWWGGDAYTMMATDPGFAHWTRIVRSAWKDKGKRVVLWPEMYTPEKLDRIRGEIGTYLWSANWENDPQPDEQERMFQPSYFRLYDYVEREGCVKVKPGECPCCGGALLKAVTVDPAIGKKQRNDRTAIVCSGVCPQGSLVIVSTRAARCEPGVIISDLYDTDALEKPEWIGVESVAYQKMLLWALDEESKKEGRYPLPLWPLQSDAQKERRISVLAAFARSRGVWVRPGDHDELVDEALKMTLSGTVGRHDDLIDAAAYRLQYMNRPSIEGPAPDDRPAIEGAIGMGAASISGADALKMLEDRARDRIAGPWNFG